jgi:hypothetical protein
MQLPFLGISLTDIDCRWIFGGFQDRGDMTFDIFGDVFLKNVYAVCPFLNNSNGSYGMSRINALDVFSARLVHSLSPGIVSCRKGLYFLQMLPIKADISYFIFGFLLAGSISYRSQVL